MKILFKNYVILFFLLTLTTNCSKSSDSDVPKKSDINSESNSDEQGTPTIPATEDTPETRPSTQHDQTTPPSSGTSYNNLPIFQNTSICIGLFCSRGNKKMAPKFVSASNNSILYFFPDSGELETSDGSKYPTFSFFRTKKSAREFYSLISGIFIHTLSFSTKLDLEQERTRGKELHVLSPLKSYFSLPKDDFFIPGYSQIYNEASLPNLSGRAEDPIGFQLKLTQAGSDYLYNILTGKKSALLQFEYCGKFLGLSPILPGLVNVNLQNFYEKLKLKYERGPYLANMIRRSDLINFIKDLIENKQMDYQMSFASPDYDFFVSYFINDLVEKGLIREFSMQYENPLNPDYIVNSSYESTSQITKYTFEDHKSMNVTICKIFSINEILKKYPNLYQEI